MTLADANTGDLFKVTKVSCAQVGKEDFAIGKAAAIGIFPGAHVRCLKVYGWKRSTFLFQLQTCKVALSFEEASFIEAESV
jgi:hypothetical protein